MPPRTPRSRCWTRCRTRRRSACGSTAGRCRAGRSARPAATPSSCSRWGAWTATGRRPSSRSARSAAAEGPRSPTHSSRPPPTSARGSSRTIVLVSDGKDTCQPPSPCSVAQRVAKGGVEMRIQAIGFNVDPEARAELECIASAGGGVYRDATDAESLREELRALTTRALRQYEPKGKPIKGGPSARQATLITPGPVHGPDAAGHRALVRRRAQARRDAEGEPVVHPARPQRRDQRRVARRWTSSRPTSTSRPSRTPPPATTRCSRGAGSSPAWAWSHARSASAGRPPPTRRSPSPGATTSSSGSRTARTRRSSTRPAGSRTRRRCRSRSSAAVARRSSRQTAKPEAVDTPDEPPSAPLLAGVGGGLAGLGFAGGALLLWRRRA